MRADISTLKADDVSGDRAVGEHLVDDRRQRTRVDARPDDRRAHRDRHGQRADRKYRLSDQGDAAVVIARQAALDHRVLDSLPLADEIEHHHRVREQKDHRGKETGRDVTGEVGSLPTEHRCADEPEQADADRREQRLSHRRSSLMIDDVAFAFRRGVDPARCCRDRSYVGRTCKARPRPRALDLAMGRGRHARLLARAGFLTFGVDVRLAAVREASARARSEGLIVHGWCADLTAGRLPSGTFDVLLVTRYLQRDLFPSIREAVKSPGGVVVYETFTVNQRRHGCGPTSPDHLLEPGELARRLRGLRGLVLRRSRGTRGRRPDRRAGGRARRRPREEGTPRRDAPGRGSGLRGNPIRPTRRYPSPKPSRDSATWRRCRARCGRPRWHRGRPTRGRQSTRRVRGAQDGPASRCPSRREHAR